jgi:4-amino-4-deoxy-L-arabinose transferase-like glycosyltransferase
MEASRPRSRWLPRILIAALVLRVVAAVALQWGLDHYWQRPFLIMGDAEGYWDLAGDVAAGREYAVYEPPRRVLRMPGFPAVLAVSRLVFGDALLPARLLLAVVGTLACWGVYAFGKSLLGERVGLWSAAYVAVSPTLVLFSVLILSETVFAATVVLAVYSAVPLIRRSDGPSATTKTHDSSQRDSAVGRVGIIVCAGLASAVACYVRPSWLLAPVLLTAAMFVLRRDRWRAAIEGVGVCVVMLLALLPWGLRNQRATGHFVVTTLWMGPSLYDGLHHGATGDSDMTFFDAENLQGRGMSEFQVNAHYKERAVQFAREHPGRAVELAFIKLWRFWSPWPNADQFRGLLPLLATLASSVPLFVFALVGAWRHRRDGGLLLLTAGPVLYFSALHLVFVSSLRYRLPAEYPLAVLAAAGLVALWSRRSGVSATTGSLASEVRS